MSKTKVTLRFATVGASAGDVIEVDADTAAHLIENGNATAVAGSPAKSDKG